MPNFCWLIVVVVAIAAAQEGSADSLNINGKDNQTLRDDSLVEKSPFVYMHIAKTVGRLILIQNTLSQHFFFMTLRASYFVGWYDAQRNNSFSFRTGELQNQQLQCSVWHS